MPRAIRLAALAVAVAASACAGAPPPDEPLPSTVGATPSPSPSPSPTAGPSPSAEPSPSPVPTELALPADAPAAFRRPLDPADVPVRALVPPDAEVSGTWLPQSADGSERQIAVAWSRGPDPFSREHGFVLFERFGERPAWRAVFGFTDPPSRGVLGIQARLGDVTGEGREDLLTFETTGGSGACGMWRVIAAVGAFPSTIYRRTRCDTDMALVGGRLEITAAVYGPADAHCCPSAFRITALAYDDPRWIVQSRERIESPAG